MSIEFREVSGVQMAFITGRSQPIWEVAELARSLGSVRRVARRLRWTITQVREALWHAEWSVEQLRREQQSALDAGYRRQCPRESPHLLVFPASRLREQETNRRRE